MPVTIPPLHNYWDHRPESELGDLKANDIFVAVGMALSAWEQCELDFATLFSLFLRSEFYSAVRVYGTISSNGAKQSALSEAADVFFGIRRAEKPDVDNFTLLMKHFSYGCSRRNDIAHGIVVCFELTRHSTHFLVPSEYSSRKNKSELGWSTKSPDEIVPAYRMTRADIEHFINKFSELHKWVDVYTHDMRIKYVPLPWDDPNWKGPQAPPPHNSEPK